MIITSQFYLHKKERALSNAHHTPVMGDLPSITISIHLLLRGVDDVVPRALFSFS